MYFYIAAIVAVIILIYHGTKTIIDPVSGLPSVVPDIHFDVASEEVDFMVRPAGYAASKYLDSYKYLIINYNQTPMNLFNCCNIFHKDDLIGIKCNGTWIPVAVVISVMEIDKSFSVVVLDRPLQLSGREVGSIPTKNSMHLWNTTMYPDPIKVPGSEIFSLSRWQFYPD